MQIWRTSVTGGKTSVKIAGVIAEYNPFHNGHAHHLKRTREITRCDYIVVCMDGHFTQRGEAAQWSKWTRTRMALENGADAVVEMPTLFAVRTADAFARSGVAILGGLGVDYISFGSERTDMNFLKALAEIRENEPDAVSEAIRRYLDEGCSHASARGRAVGEYLNIPSETLNQPNLILAAEYIRFIQKLYPDIQPVAVQRIGGYHDNALGKIASASAIRNAFSMGEKDAAFSCMAQKVSPDRLHGIDDLLLYKLRNMSMDEMRELPEIGEGLERRIYRLCREASDRESLLTKMKCKRYTYARLSRLLIYATLGITDHFMKTHIMPDYARILGIRADAAPLMKTLVARSKIPVVSSTGALKTNNCFELENRATDLWALLHDDPALRVSGREYTEKFVRI